MTTEIIPLGTGSAIPAAGRHLSATLLWREGRALLFDCGEGTQFRLADAGVSGSRIDAILITHLHGDHCFGLPGLLSTMNLQQRTEPLAIVGPVGLAEMLHGLPGLARDHLTFPVVHTALEEGLDEEVVLDRPAYRVVARPIEHRIFAVGYRYEEKPRPGKLDVEKARALGMTDFRDYRRVKAGEPVTLPDGRVVQPEEVVGPSKPGVSFAYVFDTRPCENGRRLAEGVDLLYHEATFGSEYARNAVQTAHTTAAEAAEIARAAGARRLLLGHFSARYNDVGPLVEEARLVFKNTQAAEELSRYPLETASPFPAEPTSIHPGSPFDRG